MERYTFDANTSTLTITAKFAKQLQNVESGEYKLLTKLRADFPGLTVRSKTHKTPTKYQTKRGEVFRCNQFKNLTYENMERFICAIQNKDELLPVFNFIKTEASAIQTNGYATVRRWFMAQFPVFRSNPVFYLNHKVAVITDITPFLSKGKSSENDENVA